MDPAFSISHLSNLIYALASALFVLVVGVFALKLLFLILRGKSQAADRQSNHSLKAETNNGSFYTSNVRLLTDLELKFYSRLKEAIPRTHSISCKVRLEDIVSVKKNLDPKIRYGLRSRIKSRHIDFVLTRDYDSRIELLIELDDSTHSSRRARKADHFKNEITAAAGIPLKRMTVSEDYDIADLQRETLSTVGFN